MEPVLHRADFDAWDVWERTALVHAESDRHRRRVDAARQVVRDFIAVAPNSAIMWSGGKDSTAMAHLACEMGCSLPLVSEKDDLDFPGELEYVTALAQQWDARLNVLTPAISPAQWIAEHATEIGADGDVHSRAAGLSKACFYGLLERENARHDGIMLGLRKSESAGRLKNRATHGVLYRKRPTRENPSGLCVATPLADWEGIDVYAYLLTRSIPLLPVYLCIGLMHQHEPWRVRKSWWLPGASGRHGGVTWLRHYWPSLYAQLCKWMPNARSMS